MTRVLIHFVVLIAAAAALDAQPREDVTTRLLPRIIKVRLPLGPCTVASSAMAIAHSVSLPSGIEFLPGPCVTPEPTGEITLLDLTVAEAMNRLVEIDRRYYWTETDGVIIIRPLAAWSDRKHFLNQTIEPLTLKDVDYPRALEQVMTALGRPPRSGGVFEGADGRLFSVETPAVAAVEALDAIVRAHGKLRWEVRYCRSEPRPEFATIFLYVFGNLPSEYGLGGSALPSADGVRVPNPCRPK